MTMNRPTIYAMMVEAARRQARAGARHRCGSPTGAWRRSRRSSSRTRRPTARLCASPWITPTRAALTRSSPPSTTRPCS
ncbi:hypothetical protein B5X24_HaOG206939 [Helicoverpa armigera]|nr:hypothetical protein B5X24_HaOG206939 [Helicoverpa armigera]